MCGYVSEVRWTRTFKLKRDLEGARLQHHKTLLLAQVIQDTKSLSGEFTQASVGIGIVK